MTNTNFAKQKAALAGAGAKSANNKASAVNIAANNASLTTSIANTRAIIGSFEKFQKERLSFVQTVADHASREQNIDVLQQAGIMDVVLNRLSVMGSLKRFQLPNYTLIKA